ncbi:hypothetical protein F1D05_10890 [Kribbella qitaiheensis]|uniref:Uncharacterized protein n=1 Tax=Kribbella qitaiheensis TaxID=1544730 RepID=A0A7G6WWE2_9ACTN|nr:hypothetical protein [Kribbella qitaiheensis]QNE18307.1 hypothetical protein F1D05_10890 [Kribbella qitaiheensis]
MSSMTHEIRSPKSTVARWMASTFPQYKPIQSEFRVSAGSSKVRPGSGVSLGTQGTAIDWWIRMLIDPAIDLRLPILGMRRQNVACQTAGMELIKLLAGPATDGRVIMNAASHENRDSEWWARTCYALALLTELVRISTATGSRLMQLDRRSSVDDLLKLANEDEVLDLIALHDLAKDKLIPQLPAGPVVTGMTFDGSKHLHADGDLIAGGLLVDFKAGQGGKPRADGTRAAQLTPQDLYQLLGYTLMDYSDRYEIRAVGIYAARFGYLSTWSVDSLLDAMAGHQVELAAARREFAEVLRDGFDNGLW